ncbi:MAG TPA: response regulator transcription factor [Bryobacteraceae bacterium]|jgi:DNA-binding NarL/FixJ family response regulator
MKDKNETERARVLIADDHPRVLSEMETLLSSEFDVVGKAADGLSMVTEAARLRPDVIVSDISMPGLSGIDASREILREHPETVIVLLTAYNDPQLVKTALHIGIRGYVHKLKAGDELVPAIHGALDGRAFVSSTCKPER